MNQTTLDPVHVTEEEDVDSILVPSKEEFVACETCDCRSYLHVLVGTTILSYCGHHGTKYEANLLKAGSIVADYRDTLLGEKRTQGEP